METKAQLSNAEKNTWPTMLKSWKTNRTDRNAEFVLSPDKNNNEKEFERYYRSLSSCQ